MANGEGIVKGARGLTPPRLESRDAKTDRDRRCGVDRRKQRVVMHLSAALRTPTPVD